MKLSAVLGIILLGLSPAAAQTPCPAREQSPGQQLEMRLSQKATFIPQGKSVVERLVELARHYRVPMGIEWVEPTPPADAPLPAEFEGTVSDLINAVLRDAPNYQARAYGGVVHVAQLTAVANPNNFLNLRLPRYGIENENLFRAEARLRLMIDLKMFPKHFRYGIGGGSGYQLDHVFASTCINLSGNNLTVRDVLNGIAAESDNALWVVRLTSDELAAKRPEWRRQKAPNEYGQANINTRWEFIPLVSAAPKTAKSTPERE